jgi:beta-galactosidase
MRIFISLLLFVSLVLTVQLHAQTTRQTILFNEGWKFHKGDLTGAEKPGFNDADWRHIDLPHDWSIEGPFDQHWASATAYLPGGIGWYRKTFTIPSVLQSRKLFLYFDGVYKNAEVWINGHFLGKRPNGFIPFQYEITDWVNRNGNNIVSVKVDHSEFADSRWYTGSGIYRNVYLKATNPVHVDLWGVQFSTPVVSKTKVVATISVSFANQSPSQVPLVVKSYLIDRYGKTVATAQQSLQIKANTNSKALLSFNFSNPNLWSTEKPYLYNLVIKLRSKGKELDRVEENVGIRSIVFDNDKGFFLNGKNMKIKGVCIHDDAGALGVAVPPEAWVRRLNALKEAGCNSLRMSHNPHADYLYDLADSMGFLVMDEAFDEWEEGKNKWIQGWNVGTPGKAGYHTYFKEWADRDIEDMVRRNYNHPSIILWSIGNEIDYPNDPYSHPVLNTGRNPQIYGRGYSPTNPSATRLTEIARQLVGDVKKKDTTRPVTAALAGVVMSNEVGYPEALDIVGYNYQEYRYPEDHSKYPNRVIYGSENGMAFIAWKAVEDNDYISAQYLWTGVDYLGEARAWPSRSNMAGILDLAGFKKPQYYFRQSLWSDKPMVYVATASLSGSNAGRRNISESWNYHNSDSVRINCFTNCTEAELFINSKSSGKKLLADNPEKTLTWNVLYEPGELLVKGYKNGKQAATYSLKTSGAAHTFQVEASGVPFHTGSRQLAHIEIKLVDEKGVAVPDASDEIVVEITGPAKLLGLESGSSISHEDYKSNHRKALNGKLLAYVQSTGQTGRIGIHISAPGLEAKEIKLQ